MASHQGISGLKWERWLFQQRFQQVPLCKDSCAGAAVAIKDLSACQAALRTQLPPASQHT